MGRWIAPLPSQKQPAPATNHATMPKQTMYTAVDTPNLPALPPKGAIVVLGSCFATAVGQQLRQNGRRVVINPLGTLFNPISTADTLSRALECEPPRREMFVETDGKWVSFDCHSDINGRKAEELAQRIEKGQRELRLGILEASMMIVTFGTALLFYREGMVIGNCHKQPAQIFTEDFATPADIETSWKRTLQKIQALNPAIEIVFTVSPVRHLLSGTHRNALSKAILRQAVGQIAGGAPRCHYFPAFEIVLDELRDYRFFGNDYAHPSPLTVNIVTERFWRSVSVHTTTRERSIPENAETFMPVLNRPRTFLEVKVPKLPPLTLTQAVQCVGGTFARNLATLLLQCGIYATFVDPLHPIRTTAEGTYYLLCVETDSTPRIARQAISTIARGVLMVSPIRKAALPQASSAYGHAQALLEAQQLMETNHNLSYFPAYEILHDELRDYRYYADDLLSPSALAMRIIVEKLIKSSVDNHGLKILLRYEALRRTLAHRPSAPQSPTYRALLQNLQEEAQALAPLLHPTLRPKISF